MSIIGNNALMVNPILVPVSIYQSLEDSSPEFRTVAGTGSTSDAAWTSALANFDTASFAYTASHALNGGGTIKHRVYPLMSGLNLPDI